MGDDDIQSLVARGVEDFSAEQIRTLVLLERIGGSLSLVSVMLIFVAYGLAPRVRNVQNTFIVFASVSNVGASIASIIAMDGLNAGLKTALCQTQSFMFEMFMQSDPWWSLAMALNVFLVFFFRASPDTFKRKWWIYCIICYGGPFIIALTLLFIRNKNQGPVYGSATIWCWVDADWDELRIYTYYLLIWICIGGSLILYFLVGFHVFRSRNHLKSFSTSRSRDMPNVEHVCDIQIEQRLPAPTNITLPDQQRRLDLSTDPDDSFYGTVITQVQVVHSSVLPEDMPPDPKPTRMTEGQSTPQVSFDESHPNVSASTRYTSTVTSPASMHKCSTHMRRIKSVTNSAVSKFLIEDPVKRAYLRTSFLFALSVLVTWIPSSMNRIHSWLVGTSPFEYQVASAAVLPLQGLWNGIIFFVTSNRMLRQCFWDWRTEQRILQDDVRRRPPPMQQRPVAMRGEDSFLDDGDSHTVGSEVELRHMATAPGKRSASL